MSEGGGQLEVSKFVWLPQGSSRTIAPSALKAKVLCASHNSALSSFDVIGERFCHLILQTGHPTREARTFAGLFNGEDLERWFLKVLCGVTAMEHASSGTPWRAPVPWLESLFKVRDPMPTECGLWINLGGCILFPSGSPSVAASPIDNPSGPDPLGLRFQFCGLELVLLLSRSVRSRYLPRGRLRPALLKVDSPGYPSVRIGMHYRYSPLGMSLRMMPVPASSGPRNSGASGG
jgi:hypothetical protein